MKQLFPLLYSIQNEKTLIIVLLHSKPICDIHSDICSTVGEKNIMRRGRFSHVAVLAYGNTLLISGGYCGSVLGDLIAYTVPLGIAKNWVSMN